MGRAPSISGALAAAGFCLLMAGAPTASAENPFPPVIDRSGRIVTAEPTGPLPDPAGYRWYRCSSPAFTSCSRVTGATASAYVLRTADIDFRIRARTVDSAGDESPFSADEGPITPAPPVNSAAPRVTGSPRSGERLRATAGTWSGRVAGDPGFGYRWQRCSSASASTCRDVPGATSATYPLGASDVGRWTRVVVTAEGLGRSQAAGPARPVGPVQAAPAAGFARLRPFPIVVIAGRLRGRTTRLSEFVVRGPRGARVSVRCRGRRCPFGRIGGTIGKRKRLRVRRAQRVFRAGQVLEIRVTGRNRVGKFTRVRFRRGRPPRRSDSCLRPGARVPTRCGAI